MRSTTAVERRSSEVLSTKLTNDSPVCHALSVHLSRAKLITRFDDQYAVAKFSKSRVCSKVPKGSTLIKSSLFTKSGSNINNDNNNRKLNYKHLIKYYNSLFLKVPEFP